MPGRWAAPGSAPAASRWSFDMGSGWQAPGSQVDAGRHQYELGAGQAPGVEAPWDVQAFGPGEMAPVDQTQYTPATGEFHPPGVQAPVDQENLSLMADPVTLGRANQALRSVRVPNQVTPLDQARNILKALGVSLEDEPQVNLNMGAATPPVGRAPGVGMGQAVGVGNVSPFTDPAGAVSDLAAKAASLLGFAPNTTQAAPPSSGAPPPSQGPVAPSEPAVAPPTPPQGVDPSQGARPQEPSLTSLGATTDPSQYPPQTGASGTPPKSSMDQIAALLAGQGEEGGALHIVNAGGGVVFVMNDKGEVVSKVTADKPPLMVKSRTYDAGLNQWLVTWSDGNQEYVKADPQKQTDPQQTTPVAMGQGYYWDPVSKTIQRVPQDPEKPEKANTQAVQNDDGTWTVVDMNTGLPVSTVGTPKEKDPKPAGQTFNVGNDVYVWNADTGKYEIQVDSPDRFVMQDGSIAELQSSGELKFIYKAPVRYQMGDNIVEQDPSTGAWNTVYEKPKEYLPQSFFDSVHGMFPDEKLPGYGAGQDVGAGADYGPGFSDPHETVPPEWLRSSTPFGYQSPIGAGAAGTPIQSPVDPESVVGTGHRFGEPVSMEGTHKGVDLQAYRNTPVKSPVDGTVSRIENDPKGLGIQVFVQGADGVEHALGHLDGVNVEIGEPVSAGDTVGIVGDTGDGATGPHLDYRQIDAQGQHLDPTAQLGPLAQMPRADDGSEPMPSGMGQAQPRWVSPVGRGSDVGVGALDSGYNYQAPRTDMRGVTGGIPVGNSGGLPFDPNNPPDTPNPGWDQATTALWATIMKLKLDHLDNEQSYNLGMSKLTQDKSLAGDTLALQRAQFEAQQKYQDRQLALQQQQATLGPYLQAAFNNPWLTRLSGQTPAWGQVGGPGGPWSPRPGANDEMQNYLAEGGVDWPTEFPGSGRPTGSSMHKLGIAANVPNEGQVQTALDPLRYHQVQDVKWTPEQIASANARGKKNIPDLTPAPGAPLPSSGQTPFKWMPSGESGDPNLRDYDYFKQHDYTNLNPKAVGKMQQGVLGGVGRKDVMKAKIPWNVYAQLSPFQRAGLRSDITLNKENFGDYQMDMREYWGQTGGPTEMPGMTMLHAASQSPLQQTGTAQLADTFGQTEGDYLKSQQRTWSKAAAPSVYQEV